MATSNKQDSFSEKDRTYIKFISYGMAGTSFIGMLSMLQLSTIDRALSAALICFAISIPFNIFVGLEIEGTTRLTNLIAENSLEIYYSGGIITVLGIILIFWHFSWIYGTVFIISCIAVFVISIIKLWNKL